MKRLLFVVFFFVLSSSVFAISFDPLEVGIGARPIALGSAYVAIASDSSAVFTNPAGMAAFKRFSFNSMSANLLGDVNYTVLSLSNTVNNLSLGAGYVGVGVNSIPISTTNQYGTPELTGQNADYGAGTMVLSVADDLNSIPVFKDLREMYWGLNLKYYFQGLSGGGSAVAGVAGSGFDMDLGFLWNPRQFYSIGVCLQDFLPASLGAQFSWNKNNIKEGFPMIAKFGTAWKIWGPDALFNPGRHRLLYSLDLDIYTDKSYFSLWHTGLEWQPMLPLSIRLGVDQKHKSSDDGTVGVDNNVTFGVGLKIKEFNFDFAYHQYGDLSDNNTHFFSIGYLLDAPAEKEIIKSQTGQRPPIPTPTIVPQPVLKTFNDVFPSYWASYPVSYLATLGIMDGFPDGTFRPEQMVSRADLASVLVKAKGADATDEEISSVNFADVPNDLPQARDIRIAVSKGYLYGYDDGVFNPKELVTHAKAAMVLSRYAGLNIPAKVSANPYPDVWKKSPEAPYIYAAKKAGLLTFLSGKYFRPEQFLTRGELAEMVSKIGFVKEKIRALLRQEVE